MGTALFKIKLMPKDYSANLDELQEKITKSVSQSGGSVTGYEIQEMAFGIKSIIASIRLSEDKSGEAMEENLRKIEDISSVDVIDYRRAVE